jgi:hypothetical protein
MNEKPLAEHDWLQQLVGEWTSESESSMGPGQPVEQGSGTETVRSLGGLWVLAEGHTSGGPAVGMTALMTLGFDPAKQRFGGTFVASCMTWLWVYEGELDHARRVLTLTAEGPGFTGGTATYHDIIEMVSADERTLTSEVLQPDGTWYRFMTTRYRRTA